MRVLVTGASGFIGGHLLPRLRSDGFETVGLDRVMSKGVPVGDCCCSDEGCRFQADVHAAGTEPRPETVTVAVA